MFAVAPSTAVSAAAAASQPVWAEEGMPRPSEGAVVAREPSEQQLTEVRRGFALMNTVGTPNALEEAEGIFGRSIEQWKELQRPPGETAQLMVARATARTERNEKAGGKLRPLLELAVQDYSDAIAGMRADPRVAPVRQDGTAEYQEFPDAFVRRGLANEGLARWQAAVDDYTSAIGLWGGAKNDFRKGEFSAGGRLGVNPFVLNFRGNALCRLGRYTEAVSDYRMAGAQFGAVQDNSGILTSLTNEALALYGAGEPEEAFRVMLRVVRRNPKDADGHAALAAVYWQRGEPVRAETEWQAVCERDEVGCSRYKDPTWVKDVRRFPPSLSSALDRFLRREAVPRPQTV